MNPTPMNRGYRRLFWASFFILIGGSGIDDTTPWIPGIIGLCIAVSGTNLIYKESSLVRFRQAWLFAIAGIVVWVIASFRSSELETVTWYLQFLYYFLGAVIILQIYVNVLVGAGEVLGGSWKRYFSRYAAGFAGLFTLSTIAMMAREVFGSTAGSPLDWFFNLLIMLQLLIGLWIMWLMADLRRKYPLVLE